MFLFQLSTKWLQDHNFKYPEREMYEPEYVLNLLQNIKDEEDQIDYSDIDYIKIVERMYSNDIQYVLSELINTDLLNQNFNNFVHILELNVNGVNCEDAELIERYLLQAIAEENFDVVEFCIKQGVEHEDAVEYAVEMKAVEMNAAEILKRLDAEVDEELVKLAIKSEPIPYDILEYFLSNGFVLCYESILDLAIKNDDEDLVDVVLNHAELDIVYDLIKCLYKHSEFKYFESLFKRFDIIELLDEIYEQDEDLSFYRLVLEQAKNQDFDNSPDIDVHELFISFEERLIIDTGLLCYPKQFNGCEDLKKLRDEFNKHAKLHSEGKLGANFIGVHLSSCNRYLSQTPVHKSISKKAETYVRSADNPLSVFVGKSNAQFKPHADLPEAKAKTGSGREANMGLYKNSMDSINAFKKLNDSSQKAYSENSIGNSKLYDAFLNNKRKICSYIANNFNKIITKKDNVNAIRVGDYYKYPCLMVFINKPTYASEPTPAALKGWTQMVISYFVGLVNYTAQKKNIDIELVRRSSFGFLTPTIAPCGQSFRINIGVIPIDYAELLLDCLCVLNEVLRILNRDYDDLNESQLNVALPGSSFIFSDDYKKYITKEEYPILKNNNVLELIWAGVDTGGRTGAYNLARTAAARDGLAANVYNALLNIANLNHINYTNAFINAIQWGFSKIKVTKNKIGFDQGESVVFQKILTSHAKIKDKKFFTILECIINIIKDKSNIFLLTPLKTNIEMLFEALTACKQNKTLENLYFNLELLNELIYGKVIYNFKGLKEDEHGSDSEIEVTNENSTPLFAKKVIVPNGMRAILTALHASAGQLHQNYLTGATKPSVFLLGAYYETREALKLLEKFSLAKDISKAGIVIYDINACQSNEEIVGKLEQNDFANTKALIIDSTSATMEEHHYWVEIFKRQKAMKYLFFVSSGFKNEQMGADKNPYGTIRIFTKEKNQRENIISFIKKYQQGVKSGISHNYRRAMKKIGFTPTNNNIIFFSPSPPNNAAATAVKKSKKSFTATIPQKKC